MALVLFLKHVLCRAPALYVVHRVDVVDGMEPSVHLCNPLLVHISEPCTGNDTLWKKLSDIFKGGI